MGDLYIIRKFIPSCNDIKKVSNIVRYDMGECQAFNVLFNDKPPYYCILFKYALPYFLDRTAMEISDGRALAGWFRQDGRGVAESIERDCCLSIEYANDFYDCYYLALMVD
jgi:hypothetical protein